MGGLQAISVILAAPPEDFPAPILIAQHISPEPRSELARVLDQRTALRVQEAHQGDRFRAGRVYVTPSGRHLQVCPDGTLSLTPAERVGLGRPSADLLFGSLAESVGERAVAVVLTGTGSDGARGVRAVRAAGGVTIAQDEASSQFAYMPRSAVETGCVDSVLALPDIAPRLMALTETTVPTETPSDWLPPAMEASAATEASEGNGAAPDSSIPADLSPEESTR